MIEIESLRFKKRGFQTILSPLESELLDALWELNNAKVRDIYLGMKKKKRNVALTSVAVGLDRLHKKGIVVREIAKGRGGSHYIYSTITSRKELQISVLDNVVDKLIGNFGSVAVSYFNERFSKKRRN